MVKAIASRPALTSSSRVEWSVSSTDEPLRARPSISMPTQRMAASVQSGCSTSSPSDLTQVTSLAPVGSSVSPT